MDEIEGDQNKNKDPDDQSDDNAKRFKLEDSGSSSNNVGQGEEAASTSLDNGGDLIFRWTPNSRKRNYRNSQDSTQDGSADQDEPMTIQSSSETVSPLVDIVPVSEEDNENEWEDYNVEDEEENDDDSSGEDFNLFSDSSAESGGLYENDFNVNDHALFKKEQPKDRWSALNEVNRRQLGYSSNLKSSELFQRRCYGSLHCVKRLELMYKMEDHAGCVNSLNFHPDGSLLASGGDDLKIVIWDWKLGKPLMKFKTKHKGNVFQSKFLHLSGDLHIASCARDGQVRLAQLSREEGLRSSRLLGSHKGSCHKLIVLPEQPHIIISVGEDGAVLSHDVRAPKSNKIITVKEDSKSVTLYSIHGNPLKTNEFCVCGGDQYVRIYDQRKSNKTVSKYTPFIKERAISRKHVTCAVYNHLGSEILASYGEDDIYLFDVNDTEPGKYIHRYEGHRNAATIKGVNFFGPKSEFVVSGSDCGYVYFWEKNTEALVQWFRGDDNGVVNCLEPHPQLPFLCTSGLDWDVKVWVPSCEEEPNMEDLKLTLRNNNRKWNNPALNDINESQMLWMLWRHLRSTRRLRATIDANNLLGDYSNSSGSDSSSDSDNSNDHFDGTSTCNPS